jgi:uncharacterized membrane protein
MMPLAGAEVQPTPLERLASTWQLPVALVALSLIPVLAGSARLAELAGGPELLPPRFDPSPVPLVVHIVSVIVFAVLGAFQFSGGRALSRSAWHNAAGQVLVVAGMLVALSALWLTLFHPHTEGGDLLYLFRLLAGGGMFTSLLLGSIAIRRRDLARHRSWMTRAYALALGAGTQVFTLGIGETLFEPTDRSTALLQGAGWAINLAVAEWFIRRGPARRSAHAIAVAR